MLLWREEKTSKNMSILPVTSPESRALESAIKIYRLLLPSCGKQPDLQAKSKHSTAIPVSKLVRLGVRVQRDVCI